MPIPPYDYLLEYAIYIVISLLYKKTILVQSSASFLTYISLLQLITELPVEGATDNSTYEYMEYIDFNVFSVGLSVRFDIK